MIDSSIIFNSISAICLIIATVFSYKNYMFFKTLENENHFYKYKMESAQRVLVASMVLVNEFQNIMSEVLDLKASNKYDSEVEKNIEDKIDLHFEEFRKAVIENSLFLPQNIINEIELFYDMFFVETDILGSEKEVESYFEQLLNKIESISDLIRIDVGVEKLNVKLKKRIKV